MGQFGYFLDDWFDPPEKENSVPPKPPKASPGHEGSSFEKENSKPNKTAHDDFGSSPKQKGKHGGSTPQKPQKQGEPHGRTPSTPSPTRLRKRSQRDRATGFPAPGASTSHSRFWKKHPVAWQLYRASEQSFVIDEEVEWFDFHDPTFGPGDYQFDSEGIHSFSEEEDVWVLLHAWVRFDLTHFNYGQQQLQKQPAFWKILSVPVESSEDEL